MVGFEWAVVPMSESNFHWLIEPPEPLPDDRVYLNCSLRDTALQCLHFSKCSEDWWYKRNLQFYGFRMSLANVGFFLS